MEALERHFQCKVSELIMVGDRYCTDVLFGNMHGMYTIRTPQVYQEGYFSRMVRFVEMY